MSRIKEAHIDTVGDTDALVIARTLAACQRCLDIFQVVQRFDPGLPGTPAALVFPFRVP